MGGFVSLSGALGNTDLGLRERRDSTIQGSGIEMESGFSLWGQGKERTLCLWASGKIDSAFWGSGIERERERDIQTDFFSLWGTGAKISLSGALGQSHFALWVSWQE